MFIFHVSLFLEYLHFSGSKSSNKIFSLNLLADKNHCHLFAILYLKMHYLFTFSCIMDQLMPCSYFSLIFLLFVCLYISCFFFLLVYLIAWERDLHHRLGWHRIYCTFQIGVNIPFSTFQITVLEEWGVTLAMDHDGVALK